MLRCSLRCLLTYDVYALRARLCLASDQPKSSWPIGKHFCLRLLVCLPLLHLGGKQVQCFANKSARLAAALFVTVVLTGCADPWPESRPGAARAPVSETLRRIALLEAGQGPGQVTLRHGNEEVAPGGPTAAALAPNGTLAVADPSGERIVLIAADGTPLLPISAPHVDHLAFTPEGDLAYLSRVTSRAHVVSQGGEPLRRVDLPVTMRWASGLRLDVSGELILETGYQESVPLASTRMTAELVEGIAGRNGLHYRTLRRGGEATIEILRAKPDLEGRAVVLDRLDVEVARGPGSLTFVGASGEGEIFVLIHDVVSSSPVTVTRRIRKYSPSGQLLAEVEPPRGMYAPAHSLSMTPDSEVLILRPIREGVELWVWNGQGGAP